MPSSGRLPTEELPSNDGTPYLSFNDDGSSDDGRNAPSIDEDVISSEGSLQELSGVTSSDGFLGLGQGMCWCITSILE